MMIWDHWWCSVSIVVIFVCNALNPFNQIIFLIADPSISNDLGCENCICWFGRDIARKVTVINIFKLECISFVICLNFDVGIYILFFQVKECCFIIILVLLVQFYFLWIVISDVCKGPCNTLNTQIRPMSGVTSGGALPEVSVSESANATGISSHIPVTSAAIKTTHCHDIMPIVLFHKYFFPLAVSSPNNVYYFISRTTNCRLYSNISQIQQYFTNIAAI